jgi:hypothetical protein
MGIRLGNIEHEMPWAGHRWTVLQDPEGNAVCVGARPYTGG